MYKFAIKATEDRNYRIELGLTEVDLQILIQGKNIVFDCKEVGLPSEEHDPRKIVIIHDSLEWQINEADVKKYFKGFIFVLKEEDIIQLREGNDVEITIPNQFIDVAFSFKK